MSFSEVLKVLYALLVIIIFGDSTVCKMLVKRFDCLESS